MLLVQQEMFGVGIRAPGKGIDLPTFGVGMRAPDKGIFLPTPFVAVDWGSKMFVSFDGGTARPYREVGKHGRTRNGQDFVALLARMFHDGFSVITEQSTVGSFGMRGREGEVTSLIERFEECGLYVVGGHAVTNYFRSRGEAYDSSTDHDLAAIAIYRIALNGGAAEWRANRAKPNRLNVQRYVDLRQAGYPADIMNVEVWPYLPPFEDLTASQRAILGNLDRPDVAAALVLSVLEPEATNKREWERIIGASSWGHPSVYRQVLHAGKPRKDYVKGQHWSGLSHREARQTLRCLRRFVLSRP